MTKRFKSKFRICKKLNKSYNNVWGIPKGDFLRCVRAEKKKKLSVYGRLLNVKQSLKLFYCNMSERCFKRNLKKSVQSPLTTLDRFVSFLESRLDVVLFRSCLSPSLHKSRQMISHGLIKLDGKTITNPGIKVNQLQLIEINKDFLIKKLGLDSSLITLETNFVSRFLPTHLEIDYKTLSIIFLWDPSYKDSYYPIKENYEVIQRFYK